MASIMFVSFVNRHFVSVVGTASHWSANRDLLKVEMTEKMQRLRRICSSSTQFCHRDTGLKNPIRMEEAATKLAAFNIDTGMKTRAGNSSLGFSVLTPCMRTE